MKTTLTLLRRSQAAVLTLALLCGASSRAHAQERVRSDWPVVNDPHATADGNLVDVQVRVGGNTAPLYFRPGHWDRHYFQAFKGRNYSLVVRNNTGQRIGVLIAVDGLNVVNGERSRLAHDEPMYVLDPYEQAVIRGWRTSLNDVRRFVFVDEEHSYAERTDQANGDMGWIRVLSFREEAPIGWRDRPWIQDRRSESDLDRRSGRDQARDEARPGSDAQPAPQAQAAPRAESEGLVKRAKERTGNESFGAAPESNPGTGWGDRRHDPVRRTEFLAEQRESDQIALRYEYESGLRALGIFPRRSRLWDREGGQLGFSQPPRR